MRSTPTTTPSERHLVGDDRREGVVLGHQVDAAVDALEALDRRLVLDLGDDDLAVVRRRALRDDHEVAVEDARVDHRVAGDAEHEVALEGAA